MTDKKKTWIIAGAVALVAVIAVVAILLLRGGAKPESVLNEYTDLLKKGNYKEMYSLISSDAKKNWTEEDFITRNKNIYEGIDASDFKMEIKDSSDKYDDGTEISYHFSMKSAAGTIAFDNKADVIKEDGDYRIVWDSTQIFPQLSDTDKVNVSVTEGSRGSILDRNGKALAQQGSVFQVGLIAGNLGNESETISAMAKVLDVSEDSIKKALSASWVQDTMFVPIKTVTAAKRAELIEELRKIEGASVQEATGRVYPYGEMTAHLTGYVQNVTAEDLEKHKNEGYTSTSIIGKSGLESIYESKLKAVSGCKIIIVDESGNLKDTVAEQKAKDGQDIRTTIDMDAQKAAYDQLKKDAGSAVIMDSHTGEVLAMVSMPAYDPNDFAMGMDTKTWDSLNNNKQKPLLNRFVSTYCPGSTFKAITGAIALDSKTITADTTFEKTDKWQKDSSWGKNYVTTTQSYSEPSNLKNAYIYSDNIFFAQVADKIGTQTYTSYLDKIGFQKQLDFPFTVAKSTYGDEMENAQKLAATGYGQGDLLVSPIHLTALYTAYVNDGSIMQPYLVYEDGKAKTMVKNAYRADTAKTVFEDLQASMSGYGDNPTNAAGKTGTAQVNHGEQEIGWLSAVNDDIAVTVMIDDTKDIGESHYVIPKVQSILNNVK